jgi:aryl-alcohol dehydrogenase-like predicted oxidoreductase
MTFGNDWKWGAEKEECKRILDVFTDVGGNFIDTSCNYTNGSSEKIIGELVKEDRDRYVIATKYTLYGKDNRNDPNAGGNARKNLRRSIKESLDRLQTDYVDILYLHMWDYTTPVQEVMRTLNDLISEGLVNYIGISDTPAWIVARANTMAEIRGWEPFVVYQFPYNLQTRDPEREIVPFCKKFDLAMANFDVLRAGLFTGKYTRKEKTDGRIAEGHWWTPSEPMLEMAKVVDKIADEIGCPSSNVAISWVLGQQGNFTPIVGARNSNQLAESLSSVEIKLTESHRDIFDEKVQELFHFNYGFPKGWLMGARDIIYGETYDRLLNHRKYE